MKVPQILAALSLLVLTRVAHAAPPEESPRSMLRVGAALSYFGRSRLEIDGREQANEYDVFGYALTMGYRFRLLEWLAVEAGGNIGKYGTTWSRQNEQSRTRAQLTLSPVFVGTMYRARSHGSRRAKPTRADYRLGIPVGLNAEWFSAESTRAVDASYDAGLGFTVSVVAGVDMYWERHGAYAELGLGGSTLGITRKSTLRADPSVGAVEPYRYSHVSWSFGWGYALQF